MKNPISDKDWSMFPERPEILEQAKNATSRELIPFIERNVENFGRRVRVGIWFGTRPLPFRTVSPLNAISREAIQLAFTERDKGYRYMIEIGGDPDDWDLDPEYTLEPFKRSFLGFRLVRNK